MTIALIILLALALGGVAFALTGGDEKTQKRVAAVAKPPGQARTRCHTRPGSGTKAQKCCSHVERRGKKPRGQKRKADHAPSP